jgi:hypothetical protein
MNRLPALGLLWLLAVVFGASPAASPSAAGLPVTAALRQGEAHAAPTIYVPARALRLPAAFPGPTSHARHTSPSADLIRARLDATLLSEGRVTAPTSGVIGPAPDARHVFPRFPTGPPLHV